jgi:hypothetical protein
MSVPTLDRPRLHPFDLVFGPSTEPIFESIRASLNQSGRSPLDRDHFLMLREVIELVRQLRPAEGLGEGIDQLAALVHHAYLFWSTGRRTKPISAGQTTQLLSNGHRNTLQEGDTFYAQLPPHQVWAQPVPGEPQEPLDGCFVSPAQDQSALRVLGVFGLHPDRAGFSVVEVSGPRPGSLARPDGSRLFASMLPGGARAGLYSLSGEEELLELGWRLLQAPSS